MKPEFKQYLEKVVMDAQVLGVKNISPVAVQTVVMSFSIFSSGSVAVSVRAAAEIFFSSWVSSQARP